ncbi:MAG: 3-octaprenyl-4-hydroxybenzoate carboxy-lyase, partial [Longimicrobiales bacterium]
HAKLVFPGVVALDAPPFTNHENAAQEIGVLEAELRTRPVDGLPLLVLCDDAGFTAATIDNFAWVTFTRSNPSHDVHGVGSFIEHKHWGCRGPLIIDARMKPHHAPPLEKDAGVERRVDRLGVRGASLHGII